MKKCFDVNGSILWTCCIHLKAGDHNTHLFLTKLLWDSATYKVRLCM